MTALTLATFALSALTVAHVFARTLAPAVPRIVAILKGQSCN